jgi:hypothetical protein
MISIISLLKAIRIWGSKAGGEYSICGRQPFKLLKDFAKVL